MTDDMPRVLEYVEKRLDEMMAVVQDLRTGQQQIIALIDRTNARIDQTNARIDQTNDRMAEQFRQVNARIDQTNARIDETNDRFHAVNNRIDRLFWAAGGSILSIVIAVGVYLVNQVIPRLVGG